ncbi:MAG: PaaI family thioesterase [Bradymonadaceae bacterium]
MPRPRKEEIDLTVGPGYRPADEHLMHLQFGRSFLAGPHADDEIIALRLYVRETDEALVARVWFGPGAQGPPGHAHGGSIAAVLDETLGSACWVAGYPVVAAELNTRFRKMLPLERIVTAEAWVERVDGRKIHPRGRIVDDDGTVYADATGLFIALESETFAAFGRQGK